MSLRSASVSSDDVSRFSAQASEWWAPQGAFRVLHQLAPVREAYVRSQISDAFGEGALANGLRVLDVGCGGGLMAEALAKRGADVLGLDASAETIGIAKAHAEGQGLRIAYRAGSVEDLVAEGAAFDCVLGLEILEHVADARCFLDALSRLVRPDGLLLLSSLNKTAKSFLLGVVMAEYALGWIPAGTHDWRRFVRPSDLARRLGRLGFETRDVTGYSYDLLRKTFQLCKGDVLMNYFLTARKKNG